MLRTVLVFIVLMTSVAHADSLTMITWNLEGPSGLSNKDLEGFGQFARDADVIVIEEALGAEQVAEALVKAGLADWNMVVSDFARDTLENPYQKQELAIVSSYQIGKIVEVDPYDRDDTDEMRAKDVDFEIPGWIPANQRGSKGSRGWLWVEIPEIKLVIAAVHLKSSRGKKGKEDETNSHKREAVASALASAIRDDANARKDWSYIVAGDFNVAPGDSYKVGVDLYRPCTDQDCRYYDQTHAIFGGGLVHGLTMRNLTTGLSASYAKGAFVDSPIDNIYAMGPLFDATTSLSLKRGDHFGADHYAIKVRVE